ncbi:kinase-like protein [Coniophora puteana RWD-64-598 SS2]|uniref:non-specific serine/threonine protein kinase n=1 Tax=Coniophora puteana (strain RWD-64-598) TaxID=741705 RepID=A0A5M3MYE0_CONPW|nr:kinase-like protein [Coniophora puteana RWD-64-598 SS2]EIW83794.1 kinase-like protein [Coniophora puteana RWD-64-598 SS2]
MFRIRRRRFLQLAFAAATFLLCYCLFKSGGDSDTSAQPSAEISSGSFSTQSAEVVIGTFDVSHEEDVTRYSPGGYHPVTIGDAFKDGRYVVRRKIGYGEYSTVWLTEDIQKKQFVALKILAANSSAGGIDEVEEVEILLHTTKANPSHPGYKHVISILDHFDHVGVHGTHICLVFELLGRGGYSLLRHYNEQLPLPMVKRFLQQFFLGLDYLHTQARIVHTDLKLDNILLMLDDPYETIKNDLRANPPISAPPQGSQGPPHTPYRVYKSQPLPVFEPPGNAINVKIVDLGVANWVDKHMRSLITSPILRAPEVVLGAPWDTSADIWSAACIVYRLLMGDELFNPFARPDASWTEEEEHIAQMIELLGRVPSSLIERGKYAHKYLEADGMLWKIAGIEPHSRSLRAMIAERHGDEVADQSYDLLSLMFRYEPYERSTAAQLAQHPWLRP